MSNGNEPEFTDQTAPSRPGLATYIGLGAFAVLLALMFFGVLG